MGDILLHRFGSAFSDFIPVIIYAAHTGFRGKGDEGCVFVGKLSAADSKLFFCKDDNASALRRFIGKGRELCRIGKLLLRHAVYRKEGVRLAVAERNGAGLIEHQDIHITGGFNGTAAHGKHICLI